MADNGAAQSVSTQAWPLPSFYFKISITNVGDMSCSEVSGLEMEYDIIGVSCRRQSGVHQTENAGVERPVSDVEERYLQRTTRRCGTGSTR